MDKYFDFKNRAQEVFDELDDKSCFICHLEEKKVFLNDYVVCLNEYNEEVGNTINVYLSNEDCEHYLLMLIIDISSTKQVTAFYNCLTKSGLNTIYLPNRDVVIINGKQVDENDERIAKMIEKNTKKVFENKVYPRLYEFISTIMEDNEPHVTVMNISEFIV